MSQIVLTSGGGKAVILPERGALLSSLTLEGQDRDLLWMPSDFDPEASSWPGGGLPFLFPFAGRVWHHGELYRYGLGEESYPMPLHGFSWAAKWQVVSASASDAHLRLVDTEASRSIFPFQFQIDQLIELRPTQMMITVTTSHRSPLIPGQPMPVAAGWHPYFSVNGTQMTVNLPAQTIHPVTTQGAAGKPRPLSEFSPSSLWPIPHDHLKSLILSDLTESETRFSYGSSPAYTMSFGPDSAFRHIVTWSNQPDRFICVEPWMSLPDAVATPAGCQWIKPGGELKVWLRISS